MLTLFSTQAACLPPKSALLTIICENHVWRLLHVVIQSVSYAGNLKTLEWIVRVALEKTQEEKLASELEDCF